jgi:hypothetical protein
MPSEVSQYSFQASVICVIPKNCLGVDKIKSRQHFFFVLANGRYLFKIIQFLFSQMNGLTESTESSRSITMSSNYEPWEETPIPISPLILQKLNTIPFATKEVSWERFINFLPSIFTSNNVSVSSLTSAWEQIKFTIGKKTLTLKLIVSR